MPNPRDVLALIERMRCIADDAQREDLLASLASVEHPTVLSFVNAHAVNLCLRSAPAFAAFRASDVLLRDGVGLQMILPSLGLPTGLNMNGTDFIPHLLQTLPKRRIAVYGTATPWLERARARLESFTPHAYCDLQHGFHPVGRYVEFARASRPELILLAMGMPRQEEVAAELKQALDHPVLIVNGGAIVDFLAGRFKRAPDHVQRAGLEWAYRLSQEPRRLFNRYVTGAFTFARTALLLRRAALARGGARNGSRRTRARSRARSRANA